MVRSLARNPLISLPVLVAAVLVEKMSSPVVEHHLLLVEERVHLHQVSRKKRVKKKTLHQHDQVVTKEDFSTCNLFSLKTTLA